MRAFFPGHAHFGKGALHTVAADVPEGTAEQMKNRMVLSGRCTSLADGFITPAGEKTRIM